MKVLYLSRNYPNSEFPLFGIWVEGLVRAMAEKCEVRVVAPVPYCPPLPSRFAQSRFRKIPKHRTEHGIQIISPRFFVGPGYSTHSIEGDSYYYGIRRAVKKLRKEYKFDIIHAQFGYPDGIAAARLAKQYNVPLIVTEHAPWVPWMNQYPRVRKQATQLAKICDRQLAVSERVRKTIIEITGITERLDVVPVGVNVEIFKPLPEGNPTDSNRIIYVGRIHPTKGSDILFKALRLLVDKNPNVRLTVVGGSLGYQHYKKQELAMRAHAIELGLEPYIDFVGEHPPTKVVEYIRQAAVLVLPSRRESFGSVLLEGLATGVPVVATRCGGPEDFINDDVGKLVDVENSTALALGIKEVLQNRDSYNPEQLRRYAVENYSWSQVASKTYQYYLQALNLISN